jgi:RNA polymerase sigma factor CnrH
MTGGPTRDSDAALARRAVAGERAAFDALVRRYQEPLYRFVRRYVGEPDEAYDLLQEALVSAWQALGRYDPERPAFAWLRRIALNKCRDWSRRRAVRQFFFRAAPLDDSAATAIAAPSEVEDAHESNLARLDAAIAALPARLKEPLLLTAFEGLSQQETGDMLGLTAKAVETRVYRARKRLAEILTSGVLAETDKGKTA